MNLTGYWIFWAANIAEFANHLSVGRPQLAICIFTEHFEKLCTGSLAVLVAERVISFLQISPTIFNESVFVLDGSV